MFNNIFGDLLYKMPEDFLNVEILPSPDELINKILIMSYFFFFFFKRETFCFLGKLKLSIHTKKE